MKAIYERAKKGETVVGTFIQIPSPEIVEIMAVAGFDYLVFDMEHSVLDAAMIRELARAAEAFGIPVIARVPENSSVEIQHVLDSGVPGVAIPGVNSVEGARRAVAACRYYPEGNRGYCPMTRAARYFDVDSTKYPKCSNDAVSVWALIEGRQGIAQRNEIAAVEGIDVILIGPYDLSISLGIPGQLKHPDVVNLIDDIIQTTNKQGTALFSSFVTTVEDFHFWRSRNANLCTFSTDAAIIMGSIRSLVAELKNGKGRDNEQ